MRSVKIIVRGRVQGVFYRASTKQKARELGVNGTVKNQSDGSVIIEATGNENAVNSLISWCKQGPELARVRSVEVEDTQLPYFTDFNVVR